MIAPHSVGKPSILLVFHTIWFILFLFLPIVLIPLFSVNAGAFMSLPFKGFSLRWYSDLFSLVPLQHAVYNSLKVASAVAILCTLLAVPAAMAITSKNLPGKQMAVGLMFFPLVIPGIVFGAALLIFFSWLGITLSLATIIFGHMVVCLPYAIAVMLPRLESMDASLLDASSDLGENPFWTFRRVTLPLILPGIIACLLMTFTVSFDEFYMSFFLSGSETTLPMYIWNQLRFPMKFPSLLALSTLMLGASMLMILASMRLAGVRKQDSRDGSP